MRSVSVLAAAVTSAMLIAVLCACSVNDGESESDGDTEKDFECECVCPDGDLPSDGDTESSGESEYAEESDGELEIESESDGDAEDEIEFDEWETEAETEMDDAPLCGSGLILSCGDRLTHSTVVEGRTNEWSGYNCSARLENGRETIYSFVSEKQCSVELRLENLVSDIDLFLLSDCDAFSCLHMSSTPLDIQEDERIEFEAAAGRTYFVSVDGYDGSVGSYTLEANCDCESDGDE